MVEGFVHPDFQRVADVFERQIRKTDGGASVAVFHRGDLVVDLWGGFRQPDDPWRRDTLAMCFSTTKGVVSTALHVLADRGLVNYDEPVATYWPEFAQNGKGGITIRHVMSHSAGLHRVGTLIDHADRMLDWSHMTDALAAAEPAYLPGTSVGYHGLTYGWLVGEVIRRVSGMNLNEFVQKNLAEPLGLNGLFIGCPPQERERAADLRASLPRLPALAYQALRRAGYPLARLGVPVNPRRIRATLLPLGFEDVVLHPDLLGAEVPAMNGYFDAVSLASMYAMLANDGSLHGTRILRPETVRAATEIQNNQLDRVIIVNMQWRLGYHRLPVMDRKLPLSFGHMGYGGSGAWADPQHNLALAMVCNRGGGTPIGDRRIMALTGAVVNAARRPPRPRAYAA